MTKTFGIQPILGTGRNDQTTMTIQGFDYHFQETYQFRDSGHQRLIGALAKYKDHLKGDDQKHKWVNTTGPLKDDELLEGDTQS